MLVGFGSALAARTNESYAAGIEQGVGGLIGAILQPLGGVGKILMIVLALSLVSNNVPMDYSLSLSMQGT
jgi:purine-cytosine permease-like protein